MCNKCRLNFKITLTCEILPFVDKCDEGYQQPVNSKLKLRNYPRPDQGICIILYNYIIYYNRHPFYTEEIDWLI